MTAITLQLNANDARLVQLALAHLIGERKRAVQYADQISPESRAEFLRNMEADKQEAREISHRIDCALNIRRRITPERVAAAELVNSLPDQPATGMDVVDCTGVIKGNADLADNYGNGGAR
ncbi:hypothetical protein [Luteimonas notoginsengisoli]|uniref:Uncharacterized protein n=1 Tax=Luteimonas notoginsengisoli TaxID=1578200 RepID=A0ABV7UQU5_9GAMM